MHSLILLTLIPVVIKAQGYNAAPYTPPPNQAQQPPYYAYNASFQTTDPQQQYAYAQSQKYSTSNIYNQPPQPNQNIGFQTTPSTTQQNQYTNTTGTHAYVGVPIRGPESPVSSLCLKGSVQDAMRIPCEIVTPQSLNTCFITAGENDATIATLIKRCPGSLPQDPVLSAISLRANGYFQSFIAFLDGGKCNIRAGPNERNELLRWIIQENDSQYTNVCLNLCRYDYLTLKNYANISHDMGWTQVEPLLNAAASNAQRQTPEEHVYDESGQQPLDPNILADLGPQEMQMFGSRGNLCAGLTADHFRNSNVDPELLAYMNTNCFKHIQANAFRGMTGDQLAAIRQWHVATPEQVSQIRPMVLYKVPFDKLGPYKQRHTSDAFHPCHGITSVQRMALGIHGDAWKAYNNRCKPPGNDASTLAPSLAMVVPMLTLLSVMLIF